MPYMYSNTDPTVGPGYPTRAELEKQRDPKHPLLYAKIPDTTLPYWASTDGEVLRDSQLFRDDQTRRVKPTINHGGYRIVSIDSKQVPLARVILTTFRGPPMVKCHVSYKVSDRFKLCNLENLSWNDPLQGIQHDTAFEIATAHTTHGVPLAQIARHFGIPGKICKEIIYIATTGNLTNYFNQTYIIPGGLYTEPHSSEEYRTPYKSIAEAWQEGNYDDPSKVSSLIEPYTNQRANQLESSDEFPNMSYSEVNIGIMMDIIRISPRPHLGYYRIFDHLQQNYPKIQQLMSTYRALPITQHDNQAQQDPNQKRAHRRRLELYITIESDTVLYQNAYKAYTSTMPFHEFLQKQRLQDIDNPSPRDNYYERISIPWDENGNDIPNKPFNYFNLQML